MLINSSTLAVSVPINLSMKLASVCVNGARETFWMRYVEYIENYWSAYIFSNIKSLSLAIDYVR